MDKGLLFWIIMLVCIVFGAGGFGPETWRGRAAVGFNVVLLVLLVILGWAQFGPPIH